MRWADWRGNGWGHRAALLDALQKVGMRHRRMRQLWARELLCSTFSGDLSRLKGLLDDGGDYHTTFKLVYYDLQVVL